MNVKKWIKKNTYSLSGKVVAITGATGDLGSELCYYLASLNANILMLNRNLEKSNVLKNKILRRYPNANIEIVKLDIGKLEDVKEVCKKLENVKIDYLILNAGVYNIPVKKSKTGYNNIFEINFIFPYYLTKNLLGNLQKSNGKVIMVSSIAHKGTKLNIEDIDYSNNASASKVYGNSKRFLMFSLFELFKNETDVSFVATHPGISPTQMTTHYHKSINWLVKFGMKILFPSPKKAVLNLLASLFFNCNNDEWLGPKYFDIWGTPKKKKLKKCDNLEREQIFKIAEDIFSNL